MQRFLETSPTKRGFRAGATVGRGLNVTLAFLYAVLVILSLVVIGSLSNLHRKLQDYPDHNNSSMSSRICILFSSQNDGRFVYGDSHACQAEIYGFAFMAAIFVLFIVVSIGRVVVAADIWLTALVECVVVAVLATFSLCLGAVITLGLSQTCNTVLDINKEENHCDRNVPNDDHGIKYYDAVDSAQASVWLSAFLLLLLVMVYGIRTFIFFFRIKTARRSPDRQPLAEMEISQNKAI